MKKLKSMFEKHDLEKIVLLAILVTIVLTWIIPSGMFYSGTFTSSGRIREGLTDIMLSGIYSTQFFIQQIMFIVFVGIFYGIMTNVSGYKALVSKIANKLKGKEKAFVIGTSFAITLLTSILTQTYVILIFIPFIISIASKMKLDKITTFACTFGSMLIGILGATYGVEGFVYFISYLNNYGLVDLTENIGIRFGVLVLTFVIFNFFTIRHMNKVNSSKKQDNLTEDLFLVEEVKNSKVKTWPITLFLILIALLAILGYVDWSNNFNITIFTKFHTWLTGLEIGDFTIISYILGNNAKAFGVWDLYTITVIMAIVVILSKIIYSTKMDDILDGAIEGIKKIIKPLILVVLIYIVFVFIYWSPFTVTIGNWLNEMSSSFNPFLTTISAVISSLFHIDFGYTGYSLGSIITSYGDLAGVANIIYVTINGLVQFVAPTSVILFFGLSYLDIPYKKWMKHIWQFALIMLVLLVVIFALLTYV